MCDSSRPKFSKGYNLNLEINVFNPIDILTKAVNLYKEEQNDAVKENYLPNYFKR